MKPLLIFTLSFLLISETHSQIKEVSIPVTESNNTYLWYEEKKKLIEKTSQTNLINSLYPFHFRLWTEDRAIEIWENKKGEINGLVFFWANEYISNIRTGQTYSKTYPINLDSARVLKNLVLSSKLVDIPTDLLIKGWVVGNDGTTYSIEYSTSTFYSFKKYWTPKSQDSIKEAKQIQAFVDKALLISNTKDAANIFSNSVPYDTYTNDGFGIILKNALFKSKKD